MIAPGISPLLVSGCFIELRAGRGNLKSRLIEESTKLSKTFENSFHACDATTELKKRNLCPQAILLIILCSQGILDLLLVVGWSFLFWWLISKSYWDGHASNFWSSCDISVYLTGDYFQCLRRVLITVMMYGHFSISCLIALYIRFGRYYAGHH